MEKEWISVLAALMGAAVGGLIALVVAVVNGHYNRQNMLSQMQLQEMKEDKKILSSKLEELHQRISEYMLDCSKYSSTVLEQTDTIPSLETYNSIADKLLIPLPKISSMVRLYAPEIWEHLEKLTASVNKLHEYGASYYKSQTMEPDKFQVYMQAILDDAQILLTHIEKESRLMIIKTR